MVPLYRGDRLAAWKLRTGLRLYDWFAGPAASRVTPWCGRARRWRIEPDLAPAAGSRCGTLLGRR